mmetsp:Transcript_14099/g.29436  ORF Transcript_14099/g.29436 Transcript_14099/m.29436 type:complete len:90 (+) Transcript_14099:163-432(+)
MSATTDCQHYNDYNDLFKANTRRKDEFDTDYDKENPILRHEPTPLIRRGTTQAIQKIFPYQQATSSHNNSAPLAPGKNNGYNRDPTRQE